MNQFGIDLGTTNSLIARYANGAVTVFKNPVGLKETLPSVVAFRGGRLLIGDKAREFLDKDPRNVVGAFKRRMGTTDTYWFESVSQTKTPVELSALVLQELKNFVQTGEHIDSVVITIPASFDTVQADATRQAGLMAGFREVTLLQEPIAASLAFANQPGAGAFDGRRWLVYDLGGGTFDVALVKTEHGEMTILDHEGDNFLGGVDFDSGIVDLFVVPHLETLTGLPNIEQELKSQSGTYNALYYQLLKRAEDAKIRLSSQAEADVDIDLTTSDGQYYDGFVTVQRAAFETAIKPAIDQTVVMIRQMLDRNQLTASDIDFVLLVGGSTYIPLVRQVVSEALGIPVSTDIDPITAVAVGAAFYAGSKLEATAHSVSAPVSSGLPTITVKMAYQRTSQDVQELFLADVEGATADCQYRIVRADGGFDSGMKPLLGRINEGLPLLTNSQNLFELRLYDAQANLIHMETNIAVWAGQYGILGQPLPHDICIEVDNLETGTTHLLLVFEKNALLPMRRVLTRTISRTIRRGSADRLILNVLEGPHNVAPYVNQSIGYIEIQGAQLAIDLIKGSDIEIILAMDESREVQITAYLTMTEQEFTARFSPLARQLSVPKLIDDLRHMAAQVGHGPSTLPGEATYLSALQAEVNQLLEEAQAMSPDDVTDRKYQLDDRKRQLARQLDSLTRDDGLLTLKERYFEYKTECRELLNEYGTSAEEALFHFLSNEEARLMRESDVAALKHAVGQMGSLLGQLRARSPQVIESYFLTLSRADMLYRDPAKAQQLIAKGNDYLHKLRWNRLLEIVQELSALLSNDNQTQRTMHGTGIR
jgi:molecular chaperone DnaK